MVIVGVDVEFEPGKKLVKIYQEKGKQIYEQLKNSAELRANTEKFKETKKENRVLKKDEKAFVFHQGEFIIGIPKESRAKWAGTIEVTTCCILCIESLSADGTKSVFSFCHVDEADRTFTFFAKFVEYLNTCGIRFEKHIVKLAGCCVFGDDEKVYNYSAVNLFSILTLLHHINVQFVVHTACVMEMNPCTPDPAVRSGAMRLDDGEFIIASFEDYGPMLVQRMGRLYVGSDGYEVYDRATDSIVIQPYPGIPEFLKPYCETMVNKTDEELKATSTSPHCESVDFVPFWRAVIQWFLGDPTVEECWPNREPCFFPL